MFAGQITKSVKTLAGVAAIFSVAATLTACDSNDAAIIGGTIAIVAGASGAFDDGNIGSDHRDHRDDHRDDRDHRGGRDDRYDRGGRGGGWGDGRGHGPGRGYAGSFELSASSPLAASATPANAVAAKYGLPLQSAAIFTKMVSDAKVGNTAALSAAGLSNDEMNRIASYKMPTNAALDQLGSKLALSRTMTAEFVGKLMQETKAQMADVNSPAWVACQRSGQWKTNANGGTCKSTEWAGCSPDTGASFCAAL